MTDAKRIDELEIRISFLENTVDTLNQQLASVTQEFSLAKQALRSIHQRMEQIDSSHSGIKDSNDETPPPHY